MTDATFGENAIPIAVEDRFVIVGVRDDGFMAPHSTTTEILADLLSDFTQSRDSNLVFDLRGVSSLHADVSDFIATFPLKKCSLLLSAPLMKAWTNSTDTEWSILRRVASHGMLFDGHPFSWHSLDLSWVRQLACDPTTSTRPEHDFTLAIQSILPAANHGFEICEIANNLASLIADRFGLTMSASALLYDSILSDLNAFWDENNDFDTSKRLARSGLSEVLSAPGESVLGDPLAELETYYECSEYLKYSLTKCSVLASLHRAQRNSLMIEFVMQAEPDRIMAVPYHAQSIFNIEPQSKYQLTDLLVGRPGVIARQTRAVFRSELEAFETLLNTPGTRESEFQRFLADNPSFLRGLGYAHVYPQVVLERTDGSTLIPDFILEPIKGDWCDVLDLKLPDAKIHVGTDDRRALGSAVHQVAAQLREYQAYFDDPRHQRHIRDRYGLHVYRPKAVAIIGRQLGRAGDQELRRAETSYADLRIVSFDALLEAARTRLLL